MIVSIPIKHTLRRTLFYVVPFCPGEHIRTSCAHFSSETTRGYIKTCFSDNFKGVIFRMIWKTFW